MTSLQKLKAIPLPGKLLILQFIWVIPYIFLTNYLERSLLPFRLLCYTQSDFLAVNEPLRKNLDSCIYHYFPNRLSDPKCSLNASIGSINDPTLPRGFEKVVVVRSAPGSVDYRNYIRSTWKPTLPADVPVVFVTGASLKYDLASEANEYGDILTLDFIDSYKNLTLKMMATYGYFLKYESMKQVVVINDDTIVNATALIIDSESTSNHPSYMIGKVSRGYPRLFFPWLLWHVPGSMYKHKCYPPFVQGSSFIISRAAMTSLLNHICQFPFVHLDDVLMGIMTNCLNIRLIHREGFDRHVLDVFSVFHYQYSRYTADEMTVLWGKIRHLL
uniref:Hexosyltransferase n=1 Tax=Panagrellus redivivus TaxID=6233 RepID=A0A7E4UTX4_PANRE